MIDVEGNKKKFILNLRSARVDVDKLIDWLSDETDFFTAPASTKFHLAERGGLCQHSLNVAKRMSTKTKDIPSAVFVGLLHDICKANFYAETTRNVKNEETGQWEKQPYYSVLDQFPFGHGDKSVYLIMKYSSMTDDEALAIKHHMGGFDTKPNDYTLSTAFEKCPLAVMLHIADLEATYFDEGRE